MFKKCVLLISSLFCISAGAVTSELLPDGLSVTGFAYTTEFGDHHWYEDKNAVAVNLDYFLGNAALRAQVSSYHHQNVRRATAEYSLALGDVDIIGKVGRFTRVDTFYNGITDSPGSWRQALLPQAGYSYRMQNGMFVIMDGIQFQTAWKINHSLLNISKYSKGTATVPDQSDIQNEALHKVIPGLELITNGSGDESYSTKFITENTQTYFSRDHYEMHPVIVGATNKTLATIAYGYADLKYDIDKFGFQYDNSKYLAQVEWFHDRFETYMVTKKQSSSQNAVGFNGMLGYYYLDNYKTYIGRSYARARELGGKHQMDSYVGTTWSKSPYTVSLEYHQGEGFAWRKYEYITLPAGQFPQWHTWVLSATYTF